MLCALTLTTPTRVKPRLFTCIPILQMRNWIEAEGEPAPEHGTRIWTQAAPCETSLGTSGSQSGSGASLMVTLASSGEGRGCA